MKNPKHKIPFCPKINNKLSISKCISNLNNRLNNPKTAKNTKNSKKSLSVIKRCASATSVKKTSKNTRKENSFHAFIPNLKTYSNQNNNKKKISLIKITPKSHKIPFDFKEIKEYDHKKKKSFITKNQIINSNKKNSFISNNSKAIQLNQDPFQFTFGEIKLKNFSNFKLMRNNSFSHSSLIKSNTKYSYVAKNKDTEIESKKNNLIKPLYPRIKILPNNNTTANNNAEFFKCIKSNSENKYSTIEWEKFKKNNNTLEKLATFYGNNLRSCSGSFSNNQKDTNIKTYYGHQIKFSTGLIPIDKNHTIFKKHKIIVKKKGENEERKDGFEKVYFSSNEINSTNKILTNKNYKFIVTKFSQQVKLNARLNTPKILIKHPSFKNLFKN